MDIDTVKTESIGKWPGILEQLGIEVGAGEHRPCPICGGSDRFRFDDKDGRGMYFCSQCGPGDGFMLVGKVLSINFVDACKEVSKIVGTVKPIPHQKESPVSPESLRKMFMESTPVMNGDMVHLYLKSRGLSSMPSCLRFHPACWEPETKKKQRAMLAVFSDHEGKAVTLHRTYITEFGGKLDIDKPKKVMPPLRKMSGGAIRLYKHESGPLGICEGIETAIAIHELMKIPVWAAVSATLLEKFRPPKNTNIIHVFGDNDLNLTGQAAAYNLAHRLFLKGKKVEVNIPYRPGADFLDELNEQSKYGKTG